MRGRKFRSVVGVLCVALLGSGTLSGCGDDEEARPKMRLKWSKGHENPKGECPSKQVIEVQIVERREQYEGPLNLVLRLYINDEETQDPVAHSSTFVKTSRTTGYFDLTVGKTLPRQLVRSGSNRLDAYVSEVFNRTTDDWVRLSDGSLLGGLYVSDCDQEQVMSSSAAPEPDSDVEQPVSDLKAVFHLANSADTFGCPFMQVVDVAGAADNADVSLKLSIDGTPVEHTAEFITEGEYVQEGFDGYFVLVAGDDFNAALEGEHTLQVEVSDGVGSVTIEGKFTADSCPPN
ncbi:MAG: hypothetical protein O3B40_09955 [Actinobacteria bacterium]|nr:hypothetical protein [Actinomycetota bacterium]